MITIAQPASAASSAPIPAFQTSSARRRRGPPHTPTQAADRDGRAPAQPDDLVMTCVAACSKVVPLLTGLWSLAGHHQRHLERTDRPNQTQNVFARLDPADVKDKRSGTAIAGGMAPEKRGRSRAARRWEQCGYCSRATPKSRTSCVASRRANWGGRRLASRNSSRRQLRDHWRDVPQAPGRQARQLSRGMRLPPRPLRRGSYQ